MLGRLTAPAVLMAVVSLSTAAGAFAPIGVAVQERDGIERHRWPLTVSVPMARGALRPDRQVKVVDSRGVSAPVQARPLASWPDGSVRWLLLDTQVDLKRGQTRHLRVEAGRAHPPTTRISASETDDGVVVDTGAVRFTVPRSRFAILDALHLTGSAQAVSGPVGTTLQAEADSGAAQPPTQLRITERGPLRVRVESEGTYGSGFDYLVRVEAYAGQPLVRIWHTLVNRHPTPYATLSRLSIDLPLAEAPTQYRYGIVGADAVAGPLSDAGMQLYQIDNQSYAVDHSARPGQLAGWIALDGEAATVGLAARWLWEEYPKSLHVHSDRLVYNLWAPEADPAKVGVGAAKTHEFVIWAAAPHSAVAVLGPAAARPLLGVVDPQWMARSGALPQAVAPQGVSARFVQSALAAARRYARRNAIERWDECGAVLCDAGVERPRTGAYGMWNWGDWNFSGYHDTTKGIDSWGNLEYDTTDVLALTCAASGDADVCDTMVAAARHFIDVDTIYACPAHPQWVGMNHPKTPLHFAFELGGPDLGHTWTQGSIAYYYLTGDERALAAARGVADYLVERVSTVDRGNPRQWGWPQIALLAVHDATGERRYLDAALAYARAGMRAHPATASTQWKQGILADALAYTHAATGDAEIEAWLKAYAAAVMQRRGHEDARAFPAVAYVAALTGNRALRAAARGRVDHLDLGSWGKPYSVNGRIGFRIESLLAAKPTPRRAVAVPTAHHGSVKR